MRDGLRAAIVRLVGYSYVYTRRVYRRLNLHHCEMPGCTRERVRGYDRCLECGAGYK